MVAMLKLVRGFGFDIEQPAVNDRVFEARSSESPGASLECNHHQVSFAPGAGFRCTACAADLSDWG
jgi:hypothetical protein